MQFHRSHKFGFTLVELLVVIAIIGILIGLLLPAVQAAREAARSMQCKNNLHQLSLATTMFHDANRAFPPARYQPRPSGSPANDCGGKETTWLVRIMPFLEQASAEQGWDYSQPYSTHNEKTRTTVPSAYMCPSRRGSSEAIGMGLETGTSTVWITLPCGCKVPVTQSSSNLIAGAVGDYGANHGDLSPGSFGLPTDFYYGGNGTGVIISSRATCNGSNLPVNWIDRIDMADIIDGTSNTVLVGEMHVPLGKIGQAGMDAFIFNGDVVFNSARVGGPTVPIVQNLRDEVNGLVSWGSWHPGVCNFAFADGSVRAVSNSIDTETLGYICNRSEGGIAKIEP